jgi:sialate O-acetylesterase
MPREEVVMRFAVVVWLLAVVATGGVPAAPPPEIGPSLLFASDGITLHWDAVAGAERYNVYRGTDPAARDLACLVFRTPAISAEDAERPPRLFTYLVAGWNADGEGSLGRASDGGFREATVPCTDDDGDGVRDDRDNCPGFANAGQRDQDANGRGDPCDPRTYDFEDDLPGERPAGMTQQGGSAPSFLVRDLSGDHAVSYDASGEGVHDRFDRLPTAGRFQDVDVYLDPSGAPDGVLTLELWSEGTFAENAGSGVQFRVEEDGLVAARLRHAREFTPLDEVALTDATRLRLRLRKGEGASSTLHVDRRDGAGWIENAAVFPIDDDHRLAGRQLGLAHHDGGRRGTLRLTGVPRQAAAPLVLRRSHDRLDEWKLYQRGPDDTAAIPVPVDYRSDVPVWLELRLVASATGQPLPGHGFADHRHELAPAPEGGTTTVEIAGTPAGGHYELEARLVEREGGVILGEDRVGHLAVGDVFLAAGQSNMSGYSGTLEPAEPPVDTVHLFGNDYRWKRASEPMDDGADQVDQVSAESPLHSLMLRFGKDVAAAIGMPVAVIPAPLGGSNLHTQWQRREDDPAHRGTLYGSSLHRVLAQGYAHPIRGVIWYQGESDVGRGTAAYRQDLERLVAHWRADLDAPELFFGNCQLATYLYADLDGWIAIQEAQRQQAAADPRSAVVALVDQPRSDNIHLSVAGYKTAGSRLARAVLDGAYGLPQTLGPRLVSIGYGPGQHNEIVLTYDRPMTGGVKTMFRVRDDNGPLTVLDSATAGTTVTLTLQFPASGTALVSYGYMRSPTGNELVAADGSGAALAFQDRPASP